MVKRINPETKSLRALADKKRARHRRRRFLDKLSICGQILKACEMAGVGRNQVKRWRNDPRFEALVQQALDAATERLESEADRRGFTGYPDKVFYEGVHVGDRTRYSDSLLAMRLKALAPDKYRERKSVNVAGPQVTVVLPDNGRTSPR